MPNFKSLAVRLLAARLYWKLAYHVEIKDQTAAMDDMEALYESGYDTAMMIRKSGTVFQWQQREPYGGQRPLVEADYNLHPGYKQPDGYGGLVQRSILFGPVYILTDQGSELLTRGELLVPSDDSGTGYGGFVSDEDSYCASPSEM